MSKFTIKDVPMLETMNVETSATEFAATIFRAVSDWLPGNYQLPSYMNGFVNYGISSPAVPNGVYEKDILSISENEEYILANVVNKTNFLGSMKREKVSMKMGRHRKTKDDFLYEQDLKAYYNELKNGGTNAIDNIINKHIEGYAKAMTISFFNSLTNPSSLTPIPQEQFNIVGSTNQELFDLIDGKIVELLDTDTAQKLGWTREDLNIASNNAGVNRLVNVSAELTRGSEGGFKLINKGNLIGELFKGVKVYANPLCKDENDISKIFIYPSPCVGILFTPLRIYFGKLQNTNDNFLLYSDWYDNTSDAGGTNLGNEIVGYKWVKAIIQTITPPPKKSGKKEPVKKEPVKKEPAKLTKKEQKALDNIANLETIVKEEGAEEVPTGKTEEDNK